MVQILEKNQSYLCFACCRDLVTICNDTFACIFSVCIEYHLKLLLFVNIPYLMSSYFIILYCDVLILYLFSALYEMSSWLWRCSQWHAIRRFLLRGGLSRLTLTQDVWTLTFFILLIVKNEDVLCMYTSFSNQYII